MGNILWLVVLGCLFVGVGVGILIAKLSNQIHKRHWQTQAEQEQIGVLTQKLVHEIRNPLNGISMNLQLLDEDFSQGHENGVDLTNRVHRVRQEVDRLDLILTNFRRYAKLPPPKFELSEPIELMEEVLAFNEPEIQSQNIEINRDIEALPLVELDPVQFKQVFLNLIINASQSMKNGGVLTIRVKSLANELLIEVQDTGDGIEAVYVDKIFDLFFSTRKEGTGVGLAIVKQIVESHGGTINVKSSPGNGAKFSIRIPVTQNI